jgi:hypothetical protein
MAMEQSFWRYVDGFVEIASDLWAQCDHIVRKTISAVISTDIVFREVPTSPKAGEMGHPQHSR